MEIPPGIIESRGIELSGVAGDIELRNVTFRYPGTERDVLRRVIGERVDLDSPITDVMTTDLASVRESDKIARAIHLLHERGLRHLPVLDDQGGPIGLITVRRVMEYLVEHFPQTIYNLPPDPSTILEAREGA